jgi:DUF2924 family protein
VSTTRGKVDNMGRMLAQGELQSLSAEIERLQTLNTEQLDERWRELFGAARPRRIYGALLIGALAYRLQEKVVGGLRPATRRVLRQVAGAPAERRPIPALSKPRLQVGAVVLREWHGTTHRVTVLEGGFQYGNQRFRSLSEVARVITGSRWSGPLFFGLKAGAKEQTDANA